MVVCIPDICEMVFLSVCTFLAPKCHIESIRQEETEILHLNLQHFDVKVLFENADKRKRECDRERKSGVHVAEPFIRRTSGSERVRQDTFLILKLSLFFTILEKFDSI